MKVRVTIDLDIDADAYAAEYGREPDREWMHREIAAFAGPALYRFFKHDRPSDKQMRLTITDPDA